MNHFKKISIIGVCTLLLFVSGCEFMSSRVQDLKGSIAGNTFTIDTFDNYGEQTLKTSGQRITVSPNVIRERSYSSDSGWGWVEDTSSVITITIDGREMESCGDTCIFYERGLEPEYDFRLDNVESEADSVTDLTMLAKSINRVKNYFGKSRVVVIKSQMGTPIYAFSGDSVYWEVSEDLPKFTKLSIDGKAMYVHRANFQIIDIALIDE